MFTRRRLPRPLLALGSLPLLAACADDEAPPRIAVEPLRYDYLGPLRLDVASLVVDDRIPPARPPRIDGGLSFPPRATLRSMAEDRLRPVGSAGSARFVLQDGSVVSDRIASEGGLGSLFVTEQVERISVRLAVRLEAERDGRAGSVEARVERSRTIDEDQAFTIRQGLIFELVRQAMADMNVEFEFQLRRSLRSFLLEGSEFPNRPLPGAVRIEPLSPTAPPTAAPASNVPPAAAPPSAAPPSAAPPAAAPPAGLAPGAGNLGTLRVPPP